MYMKTQSPVGGLLFKNKYYTKYDLSVGESLEKNRITQDEVWVQIR